MQPQQRANTEALSERSIYDRARDSSGKVPSLNVVENLLGGIAMIKKDKSGYKVVSEKGKNLGSGYKTRAAAAKRLRQVEYFKHKKG